MRYWNLWLVGRLVSPIITQYFKAFEYPTRTQTHNGVTHHLTVESALPCNSNPVLPDCLSIVHSFIDSLVTRLWSTVDQPV